MRVIYFFSETDDIETFINDTMVFIRITKGPDWGKDSKDIVAEGTTKTISHFSTKNESAKHDAKILLFFPDATKCTLKMSIGIKKDCKYDTENFNLYKFNNIYFPD